MAEYCRLHNYDGSFFPIFDAYDYFVVGFFDDFLPAPVCKLRNRCLPLRLRPGLLRAGDRSFRPRCSEMVFVSSTCSCYGRLACGRVQQAEGMESHPVFNSDEQLLAVLAMLEECRSALAASGNHDSAHLVSVAALDVRMRLNRIGDAELKLLCEAMVTRGPVEEGAREAKSCDAASDALARRPLLRLVK